MDKIKKTDSYFEGLEYFYGDTRRKNYKKAFKLLLPCAEIGVPHAQNLVGYFYSEGISVSKDEKKAFYWFKKAAETKFLSSTTKENHATALSNLAMMYEKGLGTKKNSKKAFLLYEKAAELGDIVSQCNLSVMYEEGRGITKDIVKAIHWCKKAAKLGDEIAQYNLGLSYLDGNGVKKNKRFAKIWLQKAADNGYKEAQMELKGL